MRIAGTMPERARLQAQADCGGFYNADSCKLIPVQNRQ
jgi:hypothetical protein